MSWDKGFNFRGTSAYVTDGLNETYVIDIDDYPTTRNGVTFGEEDEWTFNLDRDSGLDRRLAGLKGDGASGLRFRVDLPAAGDYEIHLAIGDAVAAQTVRLATRDDVIQLDAYAATTSGAARFVDASGVERAAADWPANEVPVTRTFASQVFRLATTAASASSAFAHVRLVQIEANTFTGALTATAGAATFSASAEFDAPVYTGQMTATAGAAAFAGSATFEAPIYSGQLVAAAAAASFAGSAEFDAPVYTGSLSATASPAVFAGSATFDESVSTGTLTLTSGAVQFSGAATFTAPPSGVPVAAFRRALWSWARTWSRSLPTWSRIWRYRSVSTPTNVPPETKIKKVSESRWFAFDFSKAPEVQGGETIADPTISGGSGLTFGAAEVLDAEFDGIPAGEGVKVQVSGGAAGSVYHFACQVTTSGGGTPEIAGRLVVVADYGSS